MERTGESTAAHRVDEVRAGIESWRRQRAKRGAMPEELWSAATDLAGLDGVYRTARALGLNYETLRWRVAEARLGEQEEQTTAAGFVELLAPYPVEPAQAAETVVELWDAERAKMTICVPGDGRVDVVALAQAFWSRGG